MKTLLAFIVSLFFALGLAASPKQVQTPGGFHNKVYRSAFALYASSESADMHDRFLCTVTSYRKVSGGYLLIGAGHCTSANEDLPSDLTYGVAEDLGLPITPVALVKAVMHEPLDYAIYFFPTTKKYPVIALGDESLARIGDKTVDVNFSLGAAKIVSGGVIASAVITNVNPKEDVHGFYLVTQFDSHGASGSAVVSEKTHRVIGLVIAGWDGATMPALVEPITTIESEIRDVDSLLAFVRLAPIPVTSSVKIVIPDDVFQTQFGEAHPFTLTVRGPNPTFTQGGYVFRVNTYGLELSDEYYYDVPVFIAQDDQGAYYLVSTNEGFSVPLRVTKKAQ